MSEKLRTRLINVERLRAGMLLFDEGWQMVKVIFINRSGKDLLSISAIDSDGLPQVMSWRRDKPIIIVSDERLNQPREV